MKPELSQNLKTTNWQRWSVINQSDSLRLINIVSTLALKQEMTAGPEVQFYFKKYGCIFLRSSDQFFKVLMSLIVERPIL